jgi:cell shape-determining protein MreD
MSLLRALGLLGVAYVALLLCSVLPVVLPGRPPVPDVALLTALYAGLTCRLMGGATLHLRDGGPAAMTAFGLALGYLQDLIGGAPRGLNALALCLLVLLLRTAATQLLVRGTGFIMAVAALTAVLFGLLLSALRVWADPDSGFFGLRLIVGQAAVTALCAPLLFALLGKVDARLWRDGRAQGLRL